MVESKAKATTSRAKIAHKLARYFRATPVHLSGLSGASDPSVSHLSNAHIIQLLEVLLREDSETAPRLGIPPMTRRTTSKEPMFSLKPQQEEPQLRLDLLLFCSPAPTEEEELLSLRDSPQETSL